MLFTFKSEYINICHIRLLLESSEIIKYQAATAFRPYLEYAIRGAQEHLEGLKLDTTTFGLR
jgi:hypothetical protein